MITKTLGGRFERAGQHDDRPRRPHGEEGPGATRPGRRDRRSIELEATPAGALALREHARGIEAIARGMLAALPDRDQRALIAILRRIRDAIEGEERHAPADPQWTDTPNCSGDVRYERSQHEADFRYGRERSPREQHLPTARRARRARARDDPRQRRARAARAGSTSRSCAATSWTPPRPARAIEGCGRVYHTAAGFLMWSRGPGARHHPPERRRHAPRHGGGRQGRRREGGVHEHHRHDGVLRARPTASFDETHFNTEPAHPLRARQDRRRAGGVRDRAIAPSCRSTSTHPGFILGPRFWKLSESVKQVADFLNDGSAHLLRGRLRRSRRRGRRARLAARDGKGPERRALHPLRRERHREGAVRHASPT